MVPTESTAVLLALTIAVIGEYGVHIMAMKGANLRNRRGRTEDTAATSSQSNPASNAASSSADAWNWDSVIRLEMDGATCSGVLIKNEGKVLAHLPSNYWREKLRHTEAVITATTGNHQGIQLAPKRLYDFNNLVVVLGLEKGANVIPTTIPVAEGGIKPGESGRVVNLNKGNAWDFKVVDNSFCQMHPIERPICFCAKATDEQIDAGLGAPFFIKQGGQQVVVGLQLYHVGNGYNKFNRFTPYKE